MNLAGTAALGGLGFSRLGMAQDAAGEAIPALNRFPRMMQEYYVAKIRAVEKRALERKNALATKADAERLARRAGELLGLPASQVLPAYEDPLAALAAELRLPTGDRPEEPLDDPALADDERLAVDQL